MAANYRDKFLCLDRPRMGKPDKGELWTSNDHRLIIPEERSGPTLSGVENCVAKSRQSVSHLKLTEMSLIV